MRGPLRLLIVLGFAVMAVLTALALRGSFDQPVRAPGVAADEPVREGDEDVVGRALRLAQIDSTQKTRWVDDIPELELASLEPGSREVFLRIANGRKCTCGCGFTLAACRRYDDQCDVSGPRARALFDSVKAGSIRSAAGFRERDPG